MPKVLRIINRFNLGGPTYNATFLTKFMDKEFETLLIGGMPEPGETDSLHITEAYNIHPLMIPELKRNPDLKQDLEAYRKIKKIIREFQPDIVHTHASKAGAIGRWAAIKCGVPVIVHTFHGHVFHSYFGQMKTLIFKNIERKLAKKSNGIIAISESQKKDLVETFDICREDKIEVIPLGFDLNKFHIASDQFRMETRERYDLEKDTVAIAIIGRLAPVKNHRMFLSVCGELAKKTSKKLKIFIVGDGEERPEIEKIAGRINAKHIDLIEMTSWIYDIHRFNAGMDIICLTSHNEGTPVSLIEAQASGVPVVSTDVGGVRDVIRDEVTGFITPPNDVEAFTEKLLILVEDNNLRNEMSKHGWPHVAEKFHYSGLVERMKRFYMRLLKEKAI